MATPEKQAPDAAPRRAGRGLRWALGLSLAVNLLVLGAVAGAAYRHAGGPGADPRGEIGARGYGSAYVRALPRPQQRAVMHALRHDGEGRVASRSERRAHFEQMLGALRAEPFDPDAVAAVLAGQRAAIHGVQRVAEAAWLEQVTAMDAGARQAYAAALEEELRRWRRPRRDRPHD